MSRNEWLALKIDKITPEWQAFAPFAFSLPPCSLPHFPPPYLQPEVYFHAGLLLLNLSFFMSGFIFDLSTSMTVVTSSSSSSMPSSSQFSGPMGAGAEETFGVGTSSSDDDVDLPLS